MCTQVSLTEARFIIKRGGEEEDLLSIWLISQIIIIRS